MYFIPIKFASPEFDEYIKLKYSLILEPLGLDIEAEDVISEQHMESYMLSDDNFLMVGAIQLDPKSGKISGLVVEDTFQDKGFGSCVLNEIEKIAKNNGLSSLHLHALKKTVDFFIKNGYCINDDNVIISGIKHYQLSKNI